MEIKIKATKLELSPELKDYVREKMDMLDRYLGNFPVINADVELERTTNHHSKGEIYRAEINLSVPGELLRVEDTGTEIYEAIDKAKDLMEKMIIKYKEKRKGL